MSDEKADWKTKYHEEKNLRLSLEKDLKRVKANRDSCKKIAFNRKTAREKYKLAHQSERNARIMLQKDVERLNAECYSLRSQLERVTRTSKFMKIALAICTVASSIFIGSETSRSNERYAYTVSEDQYVATVFPAMQDGEVTVSETTPSYVLGSIHIANGSTRCSGTVISQGEKYAAAVSAAHCFQGQIGGKFDAFNPDGSSMECELLAMDRDIDVALFRVPADKILGRSWVPSKGEIPQVGVYSAVGYTHTKGPIYKQCEENDLSGRWRSRGGKATWSYRVKRGSFGGGDSGGGVFKNGALITVISTCEKNPAAWDNKRISGCSHDELVEFLARNRRKLDGCGPYGCPPDYPNQRQHRRQPPDWRPSPNIPIRPPQQHEEPDDTPLTPAPPVPDDVPPPPNYDPPAPYPQPIRDSRVDLLIEQIKGLASEIDILGAKIAQIEIIVNQPGEKGPKGDKGDKGEDGQDGASIVAAWFENNELFFKLSDNSTISTGPLDLTGGWDEERIQAIELALADISEKLDDLITNPPSQPTPVEDPKYHLVLTVDPQAQYWPNLETRYKEASDDFSIKLLQKPSSEIEGELPALVLYKDGTPQYWWRGLHTVYQRLTDVARGQAHLLLERK